MSHFAWPVTKNRLSGLAIAVSLLLSGCTSIESTPSPGSSASPASPDSSASTDSPVVEGASGKTVLTTFTILADMAQNVGGDAIAVESITRVGAEIHGYEPVPSDIAKAQQADLVMANGMELERWFEPFLRNLDDVPAVVLTEGITPIPIAEGPYENKPNPHAWMSPQNALIYVENIRQAFVALDPENAETYNANAAAYSEQLQAIDTALKASLAAVPDAQRYLVSCEGAFSYLARDYDLKEIYIWPINAEQQSTPKQMKAVIDKVKGNDVPTIFCESTVSDESQKEVAKASGTTFGGNLYVDSLSTADGPVPTFLKLLEYDANLIADGLLGSGP